MHDLRKKALLESGKTVSRKARARVDISRGSSRQNSQPNSRASSRYPSEDEREQDSDYDDIMTVSSFSRSDFGIEEEDGSGVTDRLHNLIAELSERKGSSIQGRESALRAYAHILRHHHVAPEVEASITDIVPALLRSIKTGGSTLERASATQALAVTIITCSVPDHLNKMSGRLYSATQDDDEEAVKVNALRALGAAAMYSSLDRDELLQFLLDIVGSDGASVEAADSVLVVNAAMQIWAFAASLHADLSDFAEAALDAFTDQLDSSNADIQTTAAAAIALILESTDKGDEETGDILDLQYKHHKIQTKLNEIFRDSSKAVSKRDRTLLRDNIRDVLTSLETGKGPGYSTATDVEGNEFGYRHKVRINGLLIVIDTWELYFRETALKALLGGGLSTHILENPSVRELFKTARQCRTNYKQKR